MNNSSSKVALRRPGQTIERAWLRHAAIDYQFTACHPGRLVGREIEATERDISWLSRYQSACRVGPAAYHTTVSCQGCSQVRRRQRSFHEPGMNRVHPHLVHCILQAADFVEIRTAPFDAL
jgi:hypothetical protein